EHTGSFFFKQGIAVGDFSIGFDPNRAAGLNSGFFVEATRDDPTFVAAVLFDIEAPSALNAGLDALSIEANLRVSPELAGVLGNAALTGADVGDARVSATTSPPPLTGSLVNSGQTNVLLDVLTLSQAAGLTLAGVSQDVIAPGDLGPASVAFPIRPRIGAMATSFFYEPATLAPFGGSIEHSGLVFFDTAAGQVTVGDFSIGFDANRVTGVNSGFFVESTASIEAILFDIGAPSSLDAQAETLSIGADLFVSPEFAAFLGNAALTGADVGDALVSATADANANPEFPDVCNGDGGDQMGCTDCPCDNNADQGTIGGCLNSAGRSARLLPSGDPSASADSLRFEMTGAAPSTYAILAVSDSLATTNPANPCFGLGSGVDSALLDGIRCVVGGVSRQGTRMTDANGDVGLTSDGWGSPNLPTGGLVAQGGFTAGQVQYYQVIYRDDADLGCQTGFNTTQAVAVTIQP
ncbi:MAG: hypothetical protein AAF368_07820, partial [Planctomycetota bacterium]